MAGTTTAQAGRPAWQMLVFVAFVTIAASIVMSFVGMAASVVFTGALRWWFVASGILVALVIAAGMALAQYWHVPAVAPVYLASTTLMGAMLYALLTSVASVPFIVLMYALDVDAAAWMLLRWGFLACSLLPVAWGLMAARLLTVRRARAEMPGGRFRVLLVSDLHLGLLSGRRRLAAIARCVRKEKPDMLVIAGDFVDTEPKYLARFEKDVSSLFSSVPTYAVIGNHELYHDLPASVAWMERMGAKVLRNSTAADAGTGRIVGGVDDPQAFLSADAHRAAMEALVKNGATIVISHQPVHFRALSGSASFLLLCGHTHSGQVWPMDYVTRKVYPDGDRGHVRMNGSHMVVSAGAGTWGPPMRLGSLSEVVVIDAGEALS